MGVLANVFEAAGLTTISLSSIRSFTERTQPPRALHCEFPLGRPLGKPCDVTFQRDVLGAAFTLLEESSGPVLVDYPETIEDSSGAPLSCTLPPRDESDEIPAVAEANGLRSAYDRALAENGRSNVGRLVGPDGVTDLLASFNAIAGGTSWKEAGIPNNNLLEATKDIMSYYEEAAQALAGYVPAARAAETWFYRETEGGKLMKKAQGALKEAGNPIWFYIRPFTQK